jgi:uncharacterized ParB-like nuclease family protein
MRETKAIVLNSIMVPTKRLRALREETVKALIQSMVHRGQLQSIVVRPRKDGGYWLVAGLHRLEAAKKLKWNAINCAICDDMEAGEAELAEIDENLIRADLSPAERALHIAKRKELYEIAHPEAKATKAGGPGRAKYRRQNGDDIAERFTKDTAKKTRTPERTIQRDSTRANKVPVLLDIVGTRLDKGAEIDALAQLPVGKQRSLAEAAKRGEQVSAIARDHNLESRKLSDPMDEIELCKVIARVRRAQPRNPDTMAICDALERRLKRGSLRS